MSIISTSAPDCVSMPIGYVCSLVSRFKDDKAAHLNNNNDNYIYRAKENIGYIYTYHS